MLHVYITDFCNIHFRQTLPPATASNLGVRLGAGELIYHEGIVT